MRKRKKKSAQTVRLKECDLMTEEENKLAKKEALIFGLISIIFILSFSILALVFLLTAKG